MTKSASSGFMVGGVSAVGLTAEDCARVVMEVVPLAMRCIRGEFRRNRGADLSVPQFRVLAFLRRCPGACLFAVADHLGVARPTASVLVDRLVRRGLVARRRDPEERRQVVLQLTPAGVRQFERARHAARTWMASLLTSHSSERLGRITEGLTALAETFRAMEQRPDAQGVDRRAKLLPCDRRTR
jgi:DNA-binding MarR family transcriptional regulator